jgi:hypothetical protein
MRPVLQGTIALQVCIDCDTILETDSVRTALTLLLGSLACYSCLSLNPYNPSRNPCSFWPVRVFDLKLQAATLSKQRFMISCTCMK